ncbi:Reticuline oxidase-like protein [Panicum miliaceum]|uniref:Reticuline oxidase-like protein n=1 Tax=Panicum miliaceum TaxID=4540 RepID=A0A3L6RXF1_PANMI|nr:Reticuline oxidase-like protein [Panicum miliaceum]
MANPRAGSPRRAHHQGGHPEPAGPVPVPVPRHVQPAPPGDELPVPGARHDARRLPGDDLAAVHALHQLRQYRPDTGALLNRTTNLSTFTKNKSDYVKQAITRESWQKIFPWFNGPSAGLIILEPHGGQVSRIADGDTPYPHRSGVLYNIQHIAFWSGDGTAATTWINGFYSFMGQFVTKNPRAAYVNYRDLDIGQNAVVGGVTSYDSGRVWGDKYFGAANFKRLAITKGKLDPDDYFRNEQRASRHLSQLPSK